ncbi:MAG: competence/damage-inducible protein A [Nevskiales bacterium]
MRIGLVLIGEELLSGKRQDKHLPWMIQALAARRLELSWAHVLGDDEAALSELFSKTMASNDLVFSCGGIGATPDDCTRQAAARAAGRALVRHPAAAQLLEDRYGDQAYPQRINMAYFAEGAELIPNPVNQVAGFSIGHHYFVPGFPNMAQPMIEWVLDTKYSHLSPEQAQVEYGLRVHDVPESELIELMESLLGQFSGLRLSSLPDSNNRRFVELSVRGLAAEAAAAYQAMHGNLSARNIQLSDLNGPEANKETV